MVKVISLSLKQLFLHTYIKMDAGSICFMLNIITFCQQRHTFISWQFYFSKIRLEFTLVTERKFQCQFFFPQKPLRIIIMRAGQMTHISLTPKRWSGRGLLGWVQPQSEIWILGHCIECHQSTIVSSAYSCARSLCGCSLMAFDLLDSYSTNLYIFEHSKLTLRLIQIGISKLFSLSGAT